MVHDGEAISTIKRDMFKETSTIKWEKYDVVSNIGFELRNVELMLVKVE